MYVYAACARSAFVSLEKFRIHPSFDLFSPPPPPQTSPPFPICLRIPNFVSSHDLRNPHTLQLVGHFRLLFFYLFSPHIIRHLKYAYTHLSTHVLYS